MVKDFREQLFLVQLQIGKPSNPIDVQALAEECCKVWGHDYVHVGHQGFLPSPQAYFPHPQTIGGTPVVTDHKCRRCGHERHPTEKT
jgi:hypothetical protein